MANENKAAQAAKGAAQKTGGLFKEFKDFISKGNVLDMAVGVIIGGAFTTIVNSLVDDILMPFIGTIMIGTNFHDLGIRIPWGKNPYIDFGNFIQNIIIFLLTALCMFAIIKLFGVFKRKQTAPPEPPKPTNEELLLTEIRDLLKEQNK